MWNGVDAFAESPLAVVPSQFDESSANQFRKLLDDPNADLLFVLKTRPVLLTADQVSEFVASGYPMATEPIASIRAADLAPSGFRYFSDQGFIEDTADDPIIAPRRLIEPYTFEAEIPIPGGLDSRGSFGFGSIQIANADGALDDLAARSSWTGQSVELLVGGTYHVGRSSERTLTPDEWGPIFSGICNSIEYDQDVIDLGIRAPGAGLAADLNASAYTGDGDFEGDDNIKGRPKPRAFGMVRNYAPPEVNETDHVFQVNDGAIQSVDAVRVQGVEFTSDGDTTDILAWSPVAGRYKTDLSRGLVRIGEDPDGTVTVDFKGDAAGGYVNTAPAIVRRLVTDYGGLKDPDEIDAISFATFANDQVIGYTTDTTPRSVLDVVDEILAGVGAYWYFTRNGQFHVGVHRDPLAQSAPVALEITRDMIDESSLRREYTFEPIWRYRVGYRRFWHIQKASEIDETVTNKTQWSEEFRFVEAYKNANVRSTFPLSREIEIETLLDDGAGAAALGEEWGQRDRRLKHLYTFTMYRNLFKVSPGDIVSIDFRDADGETRFDLAGDQGEVIRVVENGSTRDVALSVLVPQAG